MDKKPKRKRREVYEGDRVRLGELREWAASRADEEGFSTPQAFVRAVLKRYRNQIEGKNSQQEANAA
jgi:hypothetical protein